MSRKFDNVLVTGGAGFIGSNFVRWLFQESSFEGRIINLDALTYAGNPHSLKDIVAEYGSRYIFVKGNICNAELVRKTVRDYKVDAIVHFAAESHVDRSIAHPDDFVKTNILGTHVLLEAAREFATQVKHFHHISTDEVFGSLSDQGFFTESTPYSPNSPYSASKASSDHLVRAYHHTYGLPTTLSNCSNNYGPFQFPEKLIPLMILNALEGKPLPVYGNGLNVRDWLYVTDHCSAIWTIIQNAAYGSTYNIGGRNELSNICVVRKICELLDKKAAPLPSGKSRSSLITHVKDRPGHDLRYAIDCSKLVHDFSWSPAQTWEIGFEKTVDWYLENSQWVDQVRSGEYQKWISEQYD